MAIEAGQTLLHFRLIDKIGEGGMGVVWRAADTTLDRDVAIKILPDGFATDADRLARFEREAKLLASLNHPNIASIHSVHRSDGMQFLAMELVEGEDLSQRLERGPLSIEDAVEMAGQVALALEEAHEQGVIHRDLKPANIKRSPDGKIKVLDFGLAKALDPGAALGTSANPSMSPTMTSAGTVAGMILGTASYMSPEQAKGKPVDRRADIWSFGVVLYESLTGKRLFHGETISETLAAVLMGQTDWSALPAETPRGLRRLLERCLERDPRKRLRDIGEARIAIENLSVDVESGTVEVVPAMMMRRGLGWAVAGLLVGAVASAIFFGGSGDAPPRNPAYVSVTVAPASEVVTNSTVSRKAIAFSPDGGTIAFIGSKPGDSGTVQQLVLRRFDQPEGIGVLDTDRADFPFFSPDGRTVGFVDRRRTIRSVSVEGGPADTLLESDSFDLISGASWNERLGIVFSGFHRSENTSEMIRMDPDGSNMETLLVVAEAKLFWNSALPNGKGVLFTRIPVNDTSRATLEVLSVEDRKTRVLARGYMGTYFSTGHVVFTREGKLLALPFDEAGLEATGQPQVVMAGLLIDGISGASSYAVSRAGHLAFLPQSDSMLERVNLLWVDTDGSSTTARAPGRQYTDPRISPDGSNFAFGLPSEDNDIWVHDFERETQTRLTFSDGEDETPLWSPDGVWIAYSSSRADQGRTIHRRRADGSGSEELLWEGDEHVHVSSWTPDGKTLIFDAETGVEAGMDIQALDIEGDRKARTLLGNPYDEFHSRLSPDGSWLAYTSSESGRLEIYVQRFPELDRKIQVSNDGGYQPVWSRDGRKLFYRWRTRMMVVGVPSSAATPFSKPEVLFDKEYGLGKAMNHFGYDVAGDGRFLMTLPESAMYPHEIALIFAWDQELLRRFSN